MNNVSVMLKEMYFRSNVSKLHGKIRDTTNKIKFILLTNLNQ